MTSPCNCATQNCTRPARPPAASAWRAGAPLPTLFIDEGFGTQDAEGRDRILDVIKAIEDQFERILVITHLDEVKEAFPVRIEVTRSNAGSTFSLS